MFAAKKFYASQLVTYLRADGTLGVFRFSHIPVHLEVPQDLNHDELYQVAVGEVNQEGTSFAVRVTMNLGKSGEYLVEQGIYSSYYQKKYYADWVNVNTEEAAG